MLFKLRHCEARSAVAIHLSLVAEEDGLPRRLTPARNNGLGIWGGLRHA